MAYEQFAHCYDRLMEDMPYPEWLRFLNDCWERYGRPESLADLGCGTGSISIPLASQGIQMTGIDLSADMLAIARNKGDSGLARSSLATSGGVQWIQQDMREWELPDLMDGVICFCDSLNYLLEENDVEAVFARTFRGLRDGGLFIFDVHTPYRLRSYAETQPFVLDEEDIAYLWTCELDEAVCEIEHRLTIFARDEENPSRERYIRIEETHLQRAYTVDWLKQTLLETGFASVDMVADFQWQPVNEYTERAFFIAIK